jgi:molybdenum cofactor biosynthesis enzyme MoaA
MKDLNEIGFYTLSDERVKNTSEFSQMKRAEMLITEYCNFKCKYCRGMDDKIYGKRKLKQLSLEEIKRNIDFWCLNIPLENIRFSGGEPTLHPDIKEIIKYSKKSGINRIAVSTNGSNKFELYEELIKLGVNDYSISLDTCCAEDGDKIAGDIKGSWEIVVENIRKIYKLTYTTVGVVLIPDNINKTIETIRFAHSLGVSDIRIIPAAQYNRSIPRLNEIEEEILNSHPILKFRVNNFINGKSVRGISENDSNKCALVLDDSVIAGEYHFPCVIYMREKGDPIGKVSEDMRSDRKKWFEEHDCYKDKICRENCLDICVAHNNKYHDFHGK